MNRFKSWLLVNKTRIVVSGAIAAVFAPALQPVVTSVEAAITAYTQAVGEE